MSVNRGWEASYVYNALGERVEKDLSGTYTEYAFGKDGEPEAENDRGSTNGGWVDSWVYFEGQHIAHYENGGVYYIYSNQVGTAAVVTDWTGAVIQDELHYPWGKVWTTMGTQTEERFASLHHRDAATNLDPTHFRMYSSDEGRWLTPDPAKNCPYHPENFDRYNYADNNPTNRTDPKGDAIYWIDYPYVDYGFGYYPPDFGCDPFFGCGPVFPALPFHIFSCSENFGACIHRAVYGIPGTAVLGLVPCVKACSHLAGATRALCLNDCATGFVASVGLCTDEFVLCLLGLFP